MGERDHWCSCVYTQSGSYPQGPQAREHLGKTLNSVFYDSLKNTDPLRRYRSLTTTNLCLFCEVAVHQYSSPTCFTVCPDRYTKMLLLQKLWRKKWRYVPLQPADKRHRFGRAALTTPLLPFTRWRFSRPPWRTERRHQFTRETEQNGKLPFFRLFGKPRQQRTVNESVQKTEAYPQIYLTNHPTTRPQTKRRQ